MSSQSGCQVLDDGHITEGHDKSCTNGSPGIRSSFDGKIATDGSLTFPAGQKDNSEAEVLGSERDEGEVLGGRLSFTTTRRKSSIRSQKYLTNECECYTPEGQLFCSTVPGHDDANGANASSHESTLKTMSDDREFSKRIGGLRTQRSSSQRSSLVCLRRHLLKKQRSSSFGGKNLPKDEGDLLSSLADLRMLLSRGAE